MCDALESQTKVETTSYEKLLETFDCPFNWKFNYVPKLTYSRCTFKTDKDCLPLLRLMCSIMSTFALTKENEDYAKVKEYLDDCDYAILAFTDWAHPQICERVVDYIWQATRCHILFHYGQAEKIMEIYSGMANVEALVTNKKGKSTFNACKGMMYFMGDSSGHEEGIKLLREAIDDNPNCDLWYHVLGKFYRRSRRCTFMNTRSSHEEIKLFGKAYGISKHPVYGVHLAHAYRERGNLQLAGKIYEEVARAKPDSVTVILRLALGFMNLEKFEEAKEQLDIAAKLCPTRSMYLHYRGLYHFKREEYEKALPFYEDAIKECNIPAEEQYIKCKIKVDKSFDVTEYLLTLAEKYKDRPKDYCQHLYLKIALSYYINKDNIEQSLKYFVKAIEMNPKAKSLMNFTCLYLNCDRNIFRFLKKDLLRMCAWKRADLDEATTNLVKLLKHYCFQSK